MAALGVTVTVGVAGVDTGVVVVVVGVRIVVGVTVWVATWVGVVDYTTRVRT